MDFNDRTIVLRVGSFKESDLWVRLLSASRGVFSAFAFGGSRSRKRFSGCLDLFNEVNFYIKSDRQGEYLTLQEGVLLKGPDRLRRDWKRMGMAVNCSMFVEAFCLNREHARVTHATFTDLLNLLENAPDIPQTLPLLFRARLAFEQGYALNPDQCSICGTSWQEHKEAILPVGEGGLMCRNCAPAYGRRFMLNHASLAVLKYILHEPITAWPELPESSGYAAQECVRAIDAFMQYNIGISWERGRFRGV